MPWPAGDTLPGMLRPEVVGVADEKSSNRQRAARRFGTDNEDMKPNLTPGRLYAKMWREFRRVCCERCAAGPLPIPTLAEDANEHGEGEWTVGPLQRDCAQCAKAYAQIVRRAQDKYELFDPLSTPVPYWVTEPRAGSGMRRSPSH